MIIAALFVTLLITSNIIAVKIGVIGPLTVPVAIVIFPLSYLFGDVLTEVYGYSTTRRIIWLGFACNVIAVIAISVGGAIPASSYWKDQQAYNAILGATPRVLGASFAAYLVGEFVNSFVLAKLKIATQGRWLWTRTISSTLVGQGLDSAIFVTLAFVGTLPSPVIVAAILSQWIAKSAYEIIATPVTYLVVSVLKRAEGIDTFDYSTNFSPLALAE
ncbi:MAG: queuosine precursor transporter [Chloroflexi bacterium]|nr:queuosine precursor transporter [Chloroflexota bacterium]